MRANAWIVAMGLMLSAAGAGAAPPDAVLPGAQPIAGGLYTVRFEPATPMPAGVLLVCKARLQPGFGSAVGTAPPDASAMGRGECALQLPNWLPVGAASSLSYEVRAVARDGAVLQVYSAGMALGWAVAGANTAVNVTVPLRLKGR